MTRKDYEAIAHAIGEAFAAADSVAGIRAQVVIRVSQALAADNGRFDRHRFIDRIGEVEERFRAV